MSHRTGPNDGYNEWASSTTGQCARILIALISGFESRLALHFETNKNFGKMSQN